MKIETGFAVIIPPVHTVQTVTLETLERDLLMSRRNRGDDCSMQKLFQGSYGHLSITFRQEKI